MMRTVLLLCVFAGAENLTILRVLERDNYISNITFRAVVKHLQAKNVSLYVKTVAGDDDQIFLNKLCSEYNQMITNSTPPDLIVDNTISKITSLATKSFSASMNIPTISTSYGQEGDLKGWNGLDEATLRNLVQINPPTDVIPFIVRSIVANQGYGTVAIIFDDTYDMEFKFKCLLENLPARHIITAMDRGNPISQLIHIKKVKIFNIFVLATSKNIKLVLDGADAINMFTKDFSWHAITQDREYAKCECKDARIVFARPILKKQYAARMRYLVDNLGVVDNSDVRVGFYFDVLLRGVQAARNMYESSGSKLTDYLTCQEYNGTNRPARANTDLREAILNETIDPSFGHFDLSKNGYSMLNFSMELQGINFKEGTIVAQTPLGTWNAGYDNPINFTRQDLMKTMYKSTTYYRIVAVQQKPFLFQDDEAPKKFAGYCIDLINEVATILDFDYEISEVVDGEVGKRDEDGDWNGIVREVKEGRADIGIGAISVTEERKNYVDFTVPIYDMVGHSILMKVPQEQTSLFRFINVFDASVWLVLIVFYVATSVIQWILYSLSPYGYQGRTGNDRRRIFDFKECFWFSLVAFTPQGAGEAPSNFSSKITTGAWWFFVYLMTSSYSANLSAFLTISRLEAPIKSLDDLTNQYKIQYAPVMNSLTMTYFKQMADIENRLYEKWLYMNVLDENVSELERSKYSVFDYPLSDKYTKLWNTMLQTGLPNSTEEGLERVRQSRSLTEGFALLTDATDIRYYVMANCDYQMVGEEFYKKSYAFVTQQGSPLTDQLSTVILQLINQRLMETLKEKWWARNPEAVNCGTASDSGSIGIANIGGVFIFLGFMIGFYIIAASMNHFLGTFFKRWYKTNKIAVA